MEKFSYKFGVMLLAFGVGVAAVGMYVFEKMQPLEVPPVTFENPPVQTSNDRETLEMVFVIDTTGSMGGLIEGAKQRIWGIINEVMQRQSRPRVRVGLVAYRDRSDDYVTKVLPLTEDLDKVYSTLMDYEAAGGGDTPEDVRSALSDSVSKAGWSPSGQGVAQIIFLVGDAPPKSYQNIPDVLATTAEAVRKNMIVNTIQCGNSADTQRVWQSIAQYGQGKFFAIAQDGGVQTIRTPYDEQIAALGGRMGETYMAYGSEDVRKENAEDLASTESKVAKSASNTARADRALNKAVNEEAYKGDLLQDIENGRVDADDVKTKDLPTELQPMSAPERKAEIDKRLAERKKIKEQILNLSKQRDAFIEAERKKAGKQNGFDAAVKEALGEQLTRRGIN